MATYNLGSISGKIQIEYDPSSDGEKKAKKALDDTVAAQKKADADLLAEQKKAAKEQEAILKQAAKDKENLEKLAAKSILDARKQADKDSLASLKSAQNEAAQLISAAKREQLSQEKAAAKEAQAVVVSANNDRLAAIKDNQQRSSAAVATAGTVMLGAAVATAVGLGYAVKAAADFEQELSGIQAVSGATASEMEQVRAAALRIGKDTSFSAMEAAQAMSELSKAGVSTADILDGAADATVALAAAGGVALPKAAEIAANALNLFHISAKDMPKVADLIAGAANASAISVEDFGYSMAQAGSAAALVGMSFDDMAVAITAMGKAGIKGSDAGTSLKTFLMNLQPTTEKQTSLMKELGIITEEAGNRFFDASGNIKNMSKVAGVLEESLQGMTKEQKIATLETLFGSDAIRAAAVLADTGAKGFDGLAESMGKIKAADVAATRLDNFKGSLEQLKGSVETFSIMIGSVLLPYVRKVVDGLTSLVNWFVNLDDSTKKMIVQGVLLAAALLGIGGAVAFLVGKFKDIVAAFRLIVAVIAGPGAIVLGIILAIAAAAYIIKENWDTIGPKLAQVWENIKRVASEFINWFKANFGDKIKAIWEDVKQGAQEIWATIVRVVQENQAKIKQAMSENDFSVEDVKKAINFVLDVIKVALSIYIGIIEFWITVIGRWVGAMIDAYAWVTQKAQEFIEWFKSNFGDKIAAAWDVITKTIKKAVEDLAPSWESLKGSIKEMWDTVEPIITKFYDNWEKIFGGENRKKIDTFVLAVQIGFGILGVIFKQLVAIVTATFELIMGIIDGFVEFWSGWIDIFIGLATGDWGRVWDGIRKITEGAFTVLWSIIKYWLDFITLGGFSDFVETVKGLWSGLFGWVKENTQKDLDEINRILGKGGDDQGETVAASGRNLEEIFQHTWDALNQSTVKGTNDAIRTVKDMPPTLAGSLGNLSGLLAGAGASIVQGMINGMESMRAAAYAAIAGIAAAVAAAAAAALRINSPSKIMIPIGMSVTEGIAVGITDGENFVNTAINDLANAVALSAKVNTGSLLATGGVRSAYTPQTQISETKEVNINVNNNNPVAETGTESTTRSLRRLTQMGAFA